MRRERRSVVVSRVRCGACDGPRHMPHPSSAIRLRESVCSRNDDGADEGERLHFQYSSKPNMSPTQECLELAQSNQGNLQVSKEAVFLAVKICPLPHDRTSADRCSSPLIKGSNSCG